VLHRLNYPIQTRDPETNLNNVAVVEFGRFPAPDPALPIFPFEIDRRIAEVEFAVPAAIYERIDANRTPVAELRQVATADLESLGGGRYRVPADAHAQVDFAVPDLAAPVPRPYLVLQLQATSHPPPNDVTVYFGSPDFDWARSYSFPTPGDGLSRRYYLPLHAGSERVSLDRLRWVRIAPMDPPANAPGEVEIQGLWLHSGAGFLVEPGVAEDLPR